MRSFWLFQKSPAGLSRRRTALFIAWNVAFLLCSAVCLGGVSLLYAYGSYCPDIFYDYFHHPLLLVLNIAPVVGLEVLLWCLTGRIDMSFALTGIVTLGFSIADYYKLLFRDDPLVFQDLLNIREALSITKTASYDLTPDKRVVFGIVCLVLGTAVLRVFARAGGGRRLRALLGAAVAAAAVCAVPAYASDHIYEARVVNDTHIVRWASTQVYLSKGFVYPFLHSVSSNRVTPPQGYDEDETAAILAAYTDAGIPEDKQVDLITLQLEAFTDLSRIPGLEGIDFDKAYGVFHEIEAEGIAGDLVTNIFAGGTVDTERAFLTGFADLEDFRTQTNSYAWYLRSQGYTVEGSHPSYQWFYNRRNVNGYLGLTDYWFFENYYEKVQPNYIATDRLLLPEIYKLYTANRGSGPYFSFNVTYQGHGPYSLTENSWDATFTDGRYSTETTHIVDNYLGSLEDTARQLRAFLDLLKGDERPVVVVVYGDHKPWLGDGNTAYEELGISLDTSTEEGFYNYYATRYLIWANDAAKKTLGRDLTGKGDTVSACFLMNAVFDALGWTGSPYMQATNEVHRTLPVITSVGFYVENGAVTDTLSDAGQEALHRFLSLQYYWLKHFSGGA